MREIQGGLLERKIVIGMITSSEFLHHIRPIWKSKYLGSSTCQRLAGWCIQYYDKFDKAPQKDIELIFTKQLQIGIDEEDAKDIEDILSGMSKEFEEDGQDVTALIDTARGYFKGRAMKLLVEDMDHELSNNDIQSAEELLTSFHPIEEQEFEEKIIDPFTKNSWRNLKSAFEKRESPVVRFHGSLGKFWDHELVRSGFVALMGREKIGKTFILITLGIQAIRNGVNVAFFQAGDMTEEQQLRRMAIQISGRSDQERYCDNLWVPRVDCLLHQLDECEFDNRERSVDVIFEDKKDITFESLLIASEKYKEHVPCHNCKRLIGTPWMVKRDPVRPLTWKEAYRIMQKFSKKVSGKFKLFTYPNESLTTSHLSYRLEQIRRTDGFIPDVIIIDYADLLAPDKDIARLDFRQQQNKIWQRLRRLSEEKNALVVTATQVKSSGYDTDRLLTISDFSEDKRKFAHVTAMYGLNQSNEQKRIGLMRVNELVIRESDFDSERPVTILQRLQMGRPFLGSYF